MKLYEIKWVVTVNKIVLFFLKADWNSQEKFKTLKLHFTFPGSVSQRCCGSLCSNNISVYRQSNSVMCNAPHDDMMEGSYSTHWKQVNSKSNICLHLEHSTVRACVCVSQWPLWATGVAALADKLTSWELSPQRHWGGWRQWRQQQRKSRSDSARGWGLGSGTTSYLLLPLSRHSALIQMQVI